jgi:hypothetical protein
MKKFYPKSLVLLAVLCTKFSFAQPICGFDAIHQHEMSVNPQYRRQVTENEAMLQTIIKEQQNRKATSPSTLRTEGTQAALYTIPVVVHVIHTGGAVGTSYNPTDAVITNTINYLNQVYAGTYAGMTAAGSDAAGDIQIQFALATRGPNCTATTGIERIDGTVLTGYAANGIKAATSTGVDEVVVKNLCRWDPSTYYNVYVVNRIDGNDGTAGQFIAGYARFPGGDPNLDGIVMLATQFVVGAKTLPHEIGHALNLYHPFEGSNLNTNCPPASPCGTTGDMVCDTDPITYNINGSGVITFACRSGINSCTGTAYSIRTESNFMNYTTCYTLFTPDQKTRMLAAMSLPSRSNLVNSYGISTSYPVTFASPVSTTCGSSPVTGSTGLNNYITGLTAVSVNNKSFVSGMTKEDFLAGYTTGYVDRSGACTDLIPLQLGATPPLAFTVPSANDEQVRAWIDYNNDGDFNDANEEIFYLATIAHVSSPLTISTSFNVPSTGVTTNTMLRMRVIEELAVGFGTTINSPCYNPTYGQVEDYPVYITAGPLPVSLEYFKGEKMGKAVHLSWKTATEQNTRLFDVERSNNGVDFTSIGSVAAANKATGSTYSFDDKNYSGAVIYYRLKQVDQDGSYKYSGVVTIQNETARENVVAILNNPFTDKFDISISTPIQSKVVVNLLDVTGKLLYTKTVSTLNNSLTTVSPDTKKLAAGMYFVQVNIDGNTTIKKVIKK